MRKFEAGKTYTHGYIGDSQLTATWTILKRTTQTITITDGRITKTCKIIKDLSEMRGAESVFPEGKFSKAPILSA